MRRAVGAAGRTAGDPDSNRYVLFEVPQEMHHLVQDVHHPMQEVHQGGAAGAPGVVQEVRTKEAKQGSKERTQTRKGTPPGGPRTSARRDSATFTDQDKAKLILEVAAEHGWTAEELYESDAATIWTQMLPADNGPRGSIKAYLSAVFIDFSDLAQVVAAATNKASAKQRRAEARNYLSNLSNPNFDPWGDS